MKAQAPRPGPRRLGRAGVLVAVVLAVLVVVVFVGRNLWHVSEVNEEPPAIDAGTNAGTRP